MWWLIVVVSVISFLSLLYTYDYIIQWKKADHKRKLELIKLWENDWWY